MSIKEYNSWVYTMLETPVKKRWEWVQMIYESLTSPWNKKANPLSKEMAEFATSLQKSNTFDIIGFSANVHYVKHDLRKGDQQVDLKSIFVHPWGSPKLLFQHKKLPILIIVGGDLRVDETVLDENSKNDSVRVRGITS